ncbi:hypothetical protein M9H77_29305 [Catharanthus roseus]|uniref:Uncharacterized protein n=1 Tax=Catharanthus roseus TaxID=4058 RepID=A0ACC0AKG7_CATRO|nr:hypothetical protein M9H77_29305 [Catharanthus roseus]
MSKKIFSYGQQGGEGQLGQQQYQQNRQSGMTTPRGFQSQSLEVKTQIIDSHTQSIAKLETQICQLANAISRRDERKLPSHPIENPRANYHEQAKAVITLRNGKLVDNKVREPIKDRDLNENEIEGIDIETKVEKNRAASGHRT